MRVPCREARHKGARARLYRWQQIGELTVLCIAFAAVTGWRGVRNADRAWWTPRLRTGAYTAHRETFEKSAEMFLMHADVKKANGEWVTMRVTGVQLFDESGNRIGQEGIATALGPAAVLPFPSAAHESTDRTERHRPWHEAGPYRGPKRIMKRSG